LFTHRQAEKKPISNLEHGVTPESIKSQVKDLLASPYERDRYTVPVGVAEDGKPFLGDNFTTTLRDLETRTRKAASDLEFEDAARLRDEIKRLKLLDLEFANDVLTNDGENVDKSAPKRVRGEARAEAAARFRKGGRR
jgi:excinuclease ABC subunit B